MAGDDTIARADNLFSMTEGEEQVCLTLLEEHHATEAQLEAERADDAGVAELLVDPDPIDENRAVYSSVQSTHMVDLE